MVKVSPWMVRLGGLLILLAPLLPQCSWGGAGAGPVGILGRMGETLSPVGTLDLAVGLFAPMAFGLLLILGSGREGGGAALRGLTLAALLVYAFVLSTLGSLLLTLADKGSKTSVPSFPLSLFLFVLPILLAGIALGRLAGSRSPGSSGAFARFSIGLLALLDGLFLIDHGWETLLSWMGQALVVRPLAGAWAAPVGGLLVAAGECLSRLRPRSAVDSVPTSG